MPDLYFHAGLIIFTCALGFMVWWVIRRPWRLQTGASGAGDDRGWMLDLSRMVGSTVLPFFPHFTASLKPRDRDRLEKAGLYPKWDCEEIVGLQIFGMVYGAIFLGFFVFPGQWLGTFAGAALGMWLPRWYVRKTMTERQMDLLREFPTAIDMIVLGLEGGLDITSGIKEMIENADDGPLRREFQRVHHDISMGESRTVAFRKLSHRVDAMEIRATIMSMVQAMEMGSEIGPLMRMQAEQLRFNRLMRAEEAANKAPTKMMIPMALFILPCMFLVIFAPIIISVMQSLGDLGR